MDLGNKGILKNNLDNFDEFISDLLHNSKVEECGFKNRNRLWRDIPPEIVLNFLNKVSFEQSKYRMPIKQRIIPYIERRIEKGDDLSSWNVMNVGSRETDFTRESGHDGNSITLNGVIRTRIRESNRIGASIAGPWDYVGDLVQMGWTRSDFMDSKGSMSNELMFKLRPPQNPLLVTYLIDPNSTPKDEGRGNQRTALFSKESYKVPVLGLALVLPRARISLAERNVEREFYIRLGAASLEDLLKARRSTNG